MDHAMHKMPMKEKMPMKKMAAKGKKKGKTAASVTKNLMRYNRGK